MCIYWMLWWIYLHVPLWVGWIQFLSYTCFLYRIEICRFYSESSQEIIETVLAHQFVSKRAQTANFPHLPDSESDEKKQFSMTLWKQWRRSNFVCNHNIQEVVTTMNRFCSMPASPPKISDCCNSGHASHYNTHALLCLQWIEISNLYINLEIRCSRFDYKGPATRWYKEQDTSIQWTKLTKSLCLKLYHFVFAWCELDVSHQTLIHELPVDAFLDSRSRTGPLREPCGSTTFPFCTFSLIIIRHKYNLLLLSFSNLIPSTYLCCYQLTFLQPITADLFLLPKT
jgi:hypothetical protein